MSHFYGSVIGNGTSKATRTGSEKGGLEATAAGWKGAITARVWQNEAGDDYFAVSLHPWQGSGGKTVTLAAGRLDSTFTAHPSIKAMTGLINSVVEQAESLRN